VQKGKKDYSRDEENLHERYQSEDFGRGNLSVINEHKETIRGKNKTFLRRKEGKDFGSDE
jgi:hypothetical protein